MAHTNTSSVLPGLYLELSRHGKSGEYDRALKVCDKILHEFPTEEKALQCKVVSHIQLGNFKDAVDVINKNAKNIGDVTFEKAYCLYRLNDIKEAWKLINSTASQSFKVKELKAQVLYRLENYQECFEVYKDLIKNSEDEYEEERETNLAAVVACLTAQLEQEASPFVKGAPELREHTYELCYNKACILLGLSKYADSLKKLLQAEELCKKTLEENDDPEEEIEDELAIVRTQLGYTKQKLGHSDQAMKLYNLVLKQRPSDNAIAAVAANNIVTVNKDQNVFDSKKKMKMAVSEGLESKLTSQQRRAIALNHCLLLYHTGQAEQCGKAIAAFEKNFTSAGDEAILLKAAAVHCKEKQLEKAVQLLKDYAVRNPSRSQAISFTLAQLLLSQGHINDCCDILKSLGNTTYRLGVHSAVHDLFLQWKQHCKVFSGKPCALTGRWRFTRNAPISTTKTLKSESHRELLSVYLQTHAWCKRDRDIMWLLQSKLVNSNSRGTENFSSQYLPECMKPAMSHRRKRFFVSARITVEGHFSSLPTAGTHTFSRRGSSGRILVSDPPKELKNQKPNPIYKSRSLILQLFSSCRISRNLVNAKHKSFTVLPWGVTLRSIYSGTLSRQIAALVTLYKSLEDKEAVAAIFADAIAWYKKNKASAKPRSSELNLVTRESAKFHLANGRVQEAANMLEELRKADPHDPKILAQLISAYSAFDPKKAKQVSMDLPPAEEITRQVDVDTLETTSWTMGVRYVKKVTKAEASPASRAQDIVKKKKKKKKGKLPKNFDPNVDPDPERWLPRHERSTYKKRKDRRGAASGIGKGTQGAVGSASEVDATQRTTQLQSPAPGSQPSPGAQPQLGPRQQRPLPAQKKKKKKGGRW
ncbi:unnamed protein product [Ixodes pacificus]